MLTYFNACNTVASVLCEIKTTYLHTYYFTAISQELKQYLETRAVKW